MIEILPYEPHMLKDVTQAYNDSVQDVPHSYPALLSDVDAALMGVLGGKGKEGMREEAAFCAYEGGLNLGFIHVGLGFPRHGETDEYGIIRWFCHTRGHREAGQKLLDAGETRLREFSISEIATFDSHHKYPFYGLKSSYLSERVDHVHALLGLNGYCASKGEMFLQWPHFDPTDPGPPPVECETVMTRQDHHAVLPNIMVRAMREGIQIGVCEIESVGEITQAEAAQDWAFTQWLGIEKEWQRAGLGKYLLGKGLHAARAAGYRHALISTDWRNHRAFVFYSNFGYRLSDWTYIHSKSLVGV